MKLANALTCLLMGAAAWAGGYSLIQQAPARVASRSNPLAGDEASRRAGAKLYARECAACHENREGRGKAPTLDRPDVRDAAPGTLFWVLTNGSLHHGMPSFAHLPEPERWQIIALLQAERTGN